MPIVTDAAAADWFVVVPLKPITRAKTRLGLSAEQRALLARAFVQDVVAAAQVPGVAGVTMVSGPGDRDVLPPGAGWVPDPGGGLNDAIRHAAGTAAVGQPVLVLMGDLPCLQPGDVALLVDLAGQELDAGATAVFIADQAGVGTTALAARLPDLTPRFGHRSRAEHRAVGAVELTDPRLARVRRDVDSEVDLADAVRLGVGAATRAALQVLARVD